MDKFQFKDSIGTAWLEEDGTLRIVLSRRKETRSNFNASMAIKPDNPRYQVYLDHIGPIFNGEKTNIPPWPM